MAKIGWLQDYDIFMHPGGAELNDRAQFRHGLKWHDLELVNPVTPFKRFDALIVSNIVLFDRARLQTMLTSQKTIFFFHDYVFCRWRLFYPEAAKCPRCPDKPYWLPLFQRASLLIYLSPLHRDHTYMAYPELKDIPSAVVPSAVNPDPFLNGEAVDRIPNSYFSVNTLYGFKGQRRMIQFISAHPDATFTITGENPDGIPLPENVKLIGRVPTDEISKLYRAHEFYTELPDTPQPFNRTIPEARLSGCKVVGNKLIGALSYPWMNGSLEEIATNLRNATNLFWESVNAVL